MHVDTRRQSYVYTRRRNLCRRKLLEEIYVTMYIEICLPSSAGLNYYSVGSWFSSQQIYRLRRLSFSVLLVIIAVRML